MEKGRDISENIRKTSERISMHGRMISVLIFLGDFVGAYFLIGKNKVGLIVGIIASVVMLLINLFIVDCISTRYAAMAQIAESTRRAADLLASLSARVSEGEETETDGTCDDSGTDSE